jgi:hypothetical protein
MMGDFDFAPTTMHDVALIPNYFSSGEEANNESMRPTTNNSLDPNAMNQNRMRPQMQMQGENM